MDPSHSIADCWPLKLSANLIPQVSTGSGYFWQHFLTVPIARLAVRVGGLWRHPGATHNMHTGTAAQLQSSVLYSLSGVPVQQRQPIPSMMRHRPPGFKTQGKPVLPPPNSLLVVLAASLFQDSLTVCIALIQSDGHRPPTSSAHRLLLWASSTCFFRHHLA